MENTVLRVENFSAFFGDNKILNGINLTVTKNIVAALMGPSGCGKTTLIRCVNRMHELIPGAKVSGEMHLNDHDIYGMEPIVLRRMVGMVFQKPNPFPTMSIYDNVVAGYKLNGIRRPKDEFDNIVEQSLKKAALWNEVKDNLHRKGTFLSGGQQQRLCIARALAMNPEILLLDPKSTSQIEELFVELKQNVTMLLVTHNIAQAARVSDVTAFLYLGELVESGPTEKMFTVPKDKRTEEYLTGKFG
jgi:phosphate transport system ATP-binding protein